MANKLHLTNSGMAVILILIEIKFLTYPHLP